MKGDFSRDSFDPAMHFSRVLMQQGRVHLDADWNEQGSILLHYLRTLTTDLIGPAAGPRRDCGFQIIANPNASALSDEQREDLRQRELLPLRPGDVLIGPGRYYVDGVICQSDEYASYTLQPDRDPGDPLDLKDAESFLLYLEVWERHVTAIEAPSIQEVALEVDTTTRAQVVWALRALNKGLNNPDDEDQPLLPGDTREQGLRYWEAWLRQRQEQSGGALRARTAQTGKSDSLCIVPPESQYRGPENQLYRVEIHNGGTMSADTGDENTGESPKPTFKWSRDNGAIAVPIESIGGERVRVTSLGRDTHTGLQIGTLVELSDDNYDIDGKAEPLYPIVDVDPVDLWVTLEGNVQTSVDDDPARHPLLRHWDGYAEVADGWMSLEDGIEIQFLPGTYRTGDYWLIPARIATGTIIWPQDTTADGQTVPATSAPHGIDRHYAPLALLKADNSADNSVVDLRCTFDTLVCNDPSEQDLAEERQRVG